MSDDKSRIRDEDCSGRSICQCNRTLLLQQQAQQIQDLTIKLNTIMTERDLLLCEVSRLKFELEIADLKRINDDRTDDSKQNCSSTNTSFINGSTENPEQYRDCESSSPPYWPQGICGKNTLHNGSESSQRNRLQPMYELSQDLLDKQIELLERKYGGDRARMAALTIQRAFRHYTLVKKFATITAMAKAEKRFSKRLLGLQEDTNNEGKCMEYLSINNANQENNQTPLRSLSMREKRTMKFVPPSLPRSYSGRCELTCYTTESVATQYYDPIEIMSDDKQDDDDSCQKQIKNNRVPPEVPKRTSSISVRSVEHSGVICINKNSDSASISSVQSSGSDSSIIQMEKAAKKQVYESSETASYQRHTLYKLPETVRKRQYRVGLNLFNKKPEKGVAYLIKRGFLDNSPQSVARFLISRKGLSKQMIGEYLGNLQEPFNTAVLDYFSQEIDLSGMQIDVALRRFQSYFRMPGEAQKVERLVEVFSQRYCHCNRDVVARLRSLDTVFVLAFAIIMLNTDLHTPNIKPERRMTLEDFIKNLRGVDDCCDIDRNMLIGIYERVKSNEFKPSSDHVTQVMKVQSTIVGKKPNLALPHRRLVCYCRLYEVQDIHKKERPGVHQREVFLFNDLLVITKILSKKKNSVTYTFRRSFSLSGLVVAMFEVPHYPYGIKITQRVDSKVLIIFNARNDHDRCKFVEDIRESVSEMDEMENLRIEAELEKQKSNRNGRSVSGSCSENRDSGVADVEVCTCIHRESPSHNVEQVANSHLKRTALSNSLLDIHEQVQCNQNQFHESPPIYSASIDHSDSM